MSRALAPDDYVSQSTKELAACQRLCKEAEERSGGQNTLRLEKILAFSRNGLYAISSRALDTSRPIQLYWGLVPLHLARDVPRELRGDALDALRSWNALPLLGQARAEAASSEPPGPGLSPSSSDGTDSGAAHLPPEHCGFQSHRFEHSHIMSTYGACLACAILGREAFSDRTILSREHIRVFLRSLAGGDGSFRASLTGEADTRSTYAAVTVAYLCGLLDDREMFPRAEGDESSPETLLLTEEYILRCQTYEGGFAGTPESVEAHTAYCFCSLAALSILNGFDSDAVLQKLRRHRGRAAPGEDGAARLLRFVACRQLESEGGFSGRPNKLVDACYSFWMMGLLNVLAPGSDGRRQRFPVPVSTADLRRYLSRACQDEKSGGLRDKPDARPDLYHNAYGLLGYCLSLRLDLLEGRGSQSDEGVLQAVDARGIQPEFGVYRESVEAMVAYMQAIGRG